ncbi:prefoldin subunit beta [Candidatus Pacearchaeota archaeon CG_4_9_14_0_2_um_filter_39_13]|nr:prefoldin subunit beta [Candidatus Pacearchaeota archaeon]OIO44103.1 MAG: hypothetical protein AUJ64_00595 [Candidatus Pacearchaeota archaeon CG1_02_39_14]PJC44393.1 MAG: prefoldin subunit beta [Candidatus Pacearchaeota archaeon CG_4_9_14_0_2_um_filter_39_13]
MTQSKIQELQNLERNLQMLMGQKQAIQMEIAETENALEEIKNSSSDIYKLSGTIMLKADKEKTIKELEEKNKLMELRLSSIEKQESILESRAEGLKKETQKLAEDKNVGK